MNERKIKHNETETPLGALSPIDHKMEDISVETFSQQLREHGLILSEDGFVRWDQRNPDHPRNWKRGRKAYDTAVIVFLEFIT